MDNSILNLVFTLLYQKIADRAINVQLHQKYLPSVAMVSLSDIKYIFEIAKGEGS